MKTCPECLATFTPKRDHGRFCQPSCRTTWNNRHVKQGAPLAILVKAAMATRHAKPGSRDAEICRYARAEMTRMCRDYLDDDTANDRDVVEVVGEMMDAGEQYTDRQRTDDKPLEVRKGAFLREMSEMGHNMLSATLADLNANPIKPRSFTVWQVRQLSIARNKAARLARRKSRLAA